ncbi:MAG TPA: response regulator [Bryobacteraceae bacterium]|nr:response regulator [Bryobacteraceae bacterium]
MSLRILFVDDEPRLLEGLQRSLRPLRKEWSTAFAPGGEEALAMLAAEPFDVIVTDMRMPGMDGAALLAQVSLRHPDVLRMVLSGQSDLESVVRSAGVTHQYLAKPCAIDTLKNAVNRAVALRDLLASSPLQQLVSRLGSIPSVPPVYLELMQCLKSQDASIEKVSALVRKDMGMTAKVLQLVNSSLGASGRITSAADAVAYLGLDTIRALVLTLHAFSGFQAGGAANFSIEALWRHSLATGALAERIIRSLPSATAAEHDQMRMVGLLHDIGRLVLAANLPEGYEQAHRLARQEGIAHWEAERQVFGASHAEVGAYLLGLWGLPEPIVEAVAYHHAPGNCPHPASAMLTALHVADALESAAQPKDPESLHTGPDLVYLAGAGAAGRLDEWRSLSAQIPAEEVACG